MTPHGWYKHRAITKQLVSEVGLIAYLKIILRWASEIGAK